MSNKFKSWTNRVTVPGNDVIQTICQREDGVYLAKAEGVNCATKESMKVCASIEEACDVAGWPFEVFGFPILK